MYKVIRISMYRSPDDHNPITMVARAIDLAKSVEETERGMEGCVPDAFVVSDTFDVDEATYADPLKVSLAALRRMRSSSVAQGELDMAMCYYWNTSRLGLVNAKGMIASSRPAPLTEVQLKTVLRQIARHPKYERQTVVQFTHEGKPVWLVNGRVV